VYSGDPLWTALMVCKDLIQWRPDPVKSGLAAGCPDGYATCSVGAPFCRKFSSQRIVCPPWLCPMKLIWLLEPQLVRKPLPV